MNWFQTARSEAETFFDIEQLIPEAERQQRGIAAIDAFHHIFAVLAAKLHLRDEWPEAQCHIMPFSTGIIEHSTKMNVDFTLGVSLYGWFMEAPIAFPEQIRHMKDDYWKHLVRLSMLGKAELHDYGRPCGWDGSSDIRRLTQHKGSLVFSIARDFTLLASTPEGCSSLGGIYITIPLESDETTVTTFFNNTLESLYRSNYLLYRAEYLQRRRLLKKFQRQRFP
jgi:hypothetical protein